MSSYHHGADRAHPCCPGGHMVTRRGALMGLTAALTLGRSSLAFGAAATPARLVVINVKGGLDGLSLAAPYGDPYLAKLRGALLPGAVGTPGGLLDLGGYFGLAPQMPNLHAMYATGDALLVQAVGNFAATRSHFEGQDYLQSGTAALLTSGWLNRAAGLVGTASGTLETGIAIGATTPLLLQGSAPTAGWSPDPGPSLSASVVTGLLAANAADPLLGPALRTAFSDRAQLAAIRAGWPDAPAGAPSLAVLARNAGEFLAAANGPRIAAIETNSYDTHADQVSRLALGLSDLDQALAALRLTMQSVWSRTVIVTITEFGRTAAVNGSNGTDHGTGFAMILAGGAVSGGKVLGTWPGLAPSKLYQGRDVAPTTDIRAVLNGVLGGHLGLSAAALAQVLPNAPSASPMSGLIR